MYIGINYILLIVSWKQVLAGGVVWFSIAYAGFPMSIQELTA